MRLRDPFELLREAERAELLARLREERRHRSRWGRWVAWWSALAKNLKIAATIVASAGAIAAAGPSIAHALGEAWSFYRSVYAARDPGSPLPPPTGIASTTIDRVPKPAPP